MIDITNGMLIVIISWICGTIYSLYLRYTRVLTNEFDGLGIAFVITVLYGLFRVIAMLTGH